MLTALIGVSVLLILLILGLIFRVQVLVDVLRGSAKKRAGVSNKVNALLFAAFFIIGFGLIAWYSGIASKDFLPEASSIHGKKTDFLFWLSMSIIMVAFVATHILLFFFPYIYRYKESNKALFYPDNNKLEIAWTIVPAIVLTGLIFSGWRVWVEINEESPEDHVKLEIVGKQFNWMVRYPGPDGVLGKYDFRKIDATNQLGLDFSDKQAFDDFIPREIFLPVNKPVVFHIRARDVLHSVFAPHFRVKMDAVPGMPTKFAFTPTKTTQQMRDELGNPNFNYEIACTEVCGRNHFAMRFIIIVGEEDEYKAWLAQQKSFLSQNPEYVSQIPDRLKHLAVAQ